MPNTFYFGADKILFFNAADKSHYGTIEVPAGIAVPGQRDAVDTAGGRSIYPVASRLARATGEMTVTVRECPAWLEAMMSGGNMTTVAASATPVAGAVNDQVGVISDTLVVATTAAVRTGVVVVEMTSPTAAKVTVNDGTTSPRVFQNVSISTSAVQVGTTGISLSRSSLTPALNTGDKADFTIFPAAPGGVERVSMTNADEPDYVSILAFSAPGGEDDYVKEMMIHKAKPRGLPLGFTDNETTGDIELMFKMVDPKRADNEVWTVRNRTKV